MARARSYDASASAAWPLARWIDADVVVAHREVALELSDVGVGVGQPLADGPRLLVRGERLGRVAGVVLDPGDPVQALRHGRAVAASSGSDRTRGSRSSRACSIRRQRPGELSGRLLQVADRDQALARLQLRRGVGTRLGRQGQPQLEAALERRERLGLRADPGRQLADVVVRLPERRARTAIGLLLRAGSRAAGRSRSRRGAAWSAGRRTVSPSAAGPR